MITAAPELQSRMSRTKPSSRQEQLARAFREFEHASADLTAQYRQLESQVADLTAELATARSTGQQQAEENSRLASRLEHLLNGLPAGVVVLDGNGTVQECNPVACELLGESLGGERWRDVVERAFAPRVDDGHDMSLVSGRRVSIATEAMRGEPGQILVLTDVTETRRLQQQLEHHRRLSAKTEVAAALAHQIRTPLSAAMLYASSLTATGLEEARHRGFAEKLLGRLRHLEALVDDMLLFARGGGVLDAEAGSMADLLTALVREVETCPEVRVGTFLLRIDNQAPGAEIRCNRTALLSALQNLVGNAIQACAGRGELDIRVRMAGTTCVQIEFVDNGPGVPEAIRESLFEPFVTSRSQGTGLGLAVVQAVISGHGGDINLATDGGKGAHFLVRLPVVETVSPDRADGE